MTYHLMYLLLLECIRKWSLNIKIKIALPGGLFLLPVYL